MLSVVARWRFNKGPEDLSDVSSYLWSYLVTRICGYVSRQRSADNNGFLSESIDAVARNFYGDDLLKYFETTVQTIEIRRAS